MDACEGGKCKGGGPADCNDGLDCTTDGCEAPDGCFHTLREGFCRIKGSCYDDGQANPGERCKVCSTAISQDGWSDAADGTVCEAASCVDQVWTAAQTCESGGCTGGGGTQPCDDHLPCTSDSCDPVHGCTNALHGGACLIAGACWGNGSSNPANPCEVCSTAKSTSEWSDAIEGTVCEAASCADLERTAAKTCVSGACTAGGGKQSCDDGLDCTDDSRTPDMVCGSSRHAATGAVGAGV